MSAVEIKLNSRLGARRVALVDAADAEWLAGQKWAFAGGYAVTHRPVRGFRQMHRAIMQPGAGLVVDHINGNGLDNRRANLRVCTYAQNRANAQFHWRSPKAVKGVDLRGPKGAKVWAAVISEGKKLRTIGLFDSMEGAARAYDDAARKKYGEFARLNYPEPGERGLREVAAPWWSQEARALQQGAAR